MKVHTDNLSLATANRLSEKGYMLEFEDGSEYVNITRPEPEPEGYVSQG